MVMHAADFGKLLNRTQLGRLNGSRLEQAAIQALVDLSEVLARLLTTNFRILPSIITEVLARDAERTRHQSVNEEGA
jgi:hypothetical protein